MWLNMPEDRYMEKTKYNNHEIKEVENFMYLRSKVVTNGNVTEQITKRIKKA
jgi:hypothetical protein